MAKGTDAPLITYSPTSTTTTPPPSFGDPAVPWFVVVAACCAFLAGATLGALVIRLHYRNLTAARRYRRKANERRKRDRLLLRGHQSVGWPDSRASSFAGGGSKPGSILQLRAQGQSQAPLPTDALQVPTTAPHHHHQLGAGQAAATAAQQHDDGGGSGGSQGGGGGGGGTADPFAPSVAHTATAATVEKSETDVEADAGADADGAAHAHTDPGASSGRAAGAEEGGSGSSGAGAEDDLLAAGGGVHIEAPATFRVSAGVSGLASRQNSDV